MKNKKVRMKGIGTPTILLFMHGFVDGRFKSAGIDNDGSVLNSAYINGKTDLFYKYCNERVDRLEADIASACTEAETLLMELESVPVSRKGTGADRSESIKTPKATMDSAEDSQAAGAAARKAAEQAEEKINRIERRKTDILQRLVQIRDRIANRETNCRNELSATAFALKERMCVYGHGVLLRPILNRNIPQLEYEWAFELYKHNHDEIKCRISEAVKKEGVENV